MHLMFPCEHWQAHPLAFCPCDYVPGKIIVAYLVSPGPVLTFHNVSTCNLETDAVSGCAGPRGAATRGKKRRQAREAALVAEWDWLKVIEPLDRSWLHFALYAAHQAQVNSWHSAALCFELDIYGSTEPGLGCLQACLLPVQLCRAEFRPLLHG